MGASGPSVRFALTEQQVPTHLATSVGKLSRSGIATPLRYAMTRDTPAAAAAGAQNCTCRNIPSNISERTLQEEP